MEHVSLYLPLKRHRKESHNLRRIRPMLQALLPPGNLVTAQSENLRHLRFFRYPSASRPVITCRRNTWAVWHGWCPAWHSHCESPAQRGSAHIVGKAWPSCTCIYTTHTSHNETGELWPSADTPLFGCPWLLASPGMN